MRGVWRRLLPDFRAKSTCSVNVLGGVCRAVQAESLYLLCKANIYLSACDNDFVVCLHLDDVDSGHCGNRYWFSGDYGNRYL